MSACGKAGAAHLMSAADRLRCAWQRAQRALDPTCAQERVDLRHKSQKAYLPQIKADISTTYQLRKALFSISGISRLMVHKVVASALLRASRA